MCFFDFHKANVEAKKEIEIQKRVSKNTDTLFKAFKKANCLS